MSASILAALTLLGAAQSAPPPPACTAPENRQMDFWVGDWELSFDAGNGQTGQAANRITRDEYGDCAVVEHFRQPGAGPGGGDYIGSSYSAYDPGSRRWRQMWVDNGGSSFVLQGGPVEGQPHVFELMTTEPVGGATKAFMRMIWQEVTADSLIWRWQRQTVDGGWTDMWVLNYRRRPTE